MMPNKQNKISPADLIRQMNEDWTRGESEVLKLKAWDYLSQRKVPIKVVRNNNDFELHPFASVRLTREFKKKGVVYVRTRDKEIEAREAFLEKEKTRIQTCIEGAKLYDKRAYLEDEVDKYNRKRSRVPDFKELIRIYKDKCREYEAPNDWWLDEVYVSNTMLNWLDKLTSDNHIVGATDRKSGKFIKSKADQKANGARGGKIRGERRYQKFVQWVTDTNFKVEDYRETSIANFAMALESKGFSIDGKPVSANTASSYRARFLSDLGAIIADLGQEVKRGFRDRSGFFF